MKKTLALFVPFPLLIALFLLAGCEKSVDQVAPGDQEQGEPATAGGISTSPSGSPSINQTGPKKAPISPPKSEIDALVEKMYPMPQILTLDQITKGWSAIPANAYPQQITAKMAVPFSLRAPNGSVIGSSSVPAGTPLRPLQLNGDQLVVSSLADASMRSQVPVDQTNFKEDITRRYNSFVERKKQEIDQQRARARQALVADPAKLALLKNTGPAGSKDDPRFLPVMASIQRGEAHPASLEEAKTFRWNGSERVGGQIRGTFDTVSVHFEVATIFGKFPTDYKCLLQGGKVVAWIDPITEERITKP